ncbi:MAG: hypothetical protein OXG51_16995, partial [Gammaproteobacteria bacterium]|nr:hypothetical protein [Gammaproteobacteria bacterium]
MIPTQGQSNAGAASRLGDVSTIILALWFAYLLRGPDESDRYVLAGTLAVLLYLLAPGTTASRRGGIPTLTTELRTTLQGWLWTLGCLLAIGWTTKLTGQYSRVAIGLWAVFAAFGL